MLWQMYGLINSPLLLVLFILLLVVPLLFSIAFHELSHGWMAYKMGDPTAKMMGRLTLNPLKHLDTVGTIMLLVVGIGWAKPVIVDYRNIPNRTKQMLVALAGPASNILLALIFAMIIYICENIFNFSSKNFIILLLNSTVLLNIALALFNLIPVPPLDGSRIVAWIIGEKLEEIYYKFEQYGIFILLLIMVFYGFSWLFLFARILQSYLYQILGISI